nr:MAG TPA: Repressor protein CI [Caudoviricetes sp.]
MPRNKLSHFDRNLRKQISENLKKYAGHLTQYQLSDMTGIPASTLSGYFSMRSTPNAGAVQKIADALNVNKSDIDPRFLTKALTSNDTDLKDVLRSASYCTYGGKPVKKELLERLIQAALEDES